MIRILFFVFCTLWCLDVDAQQFRPGFKAFGILGFNACQIDGDNLAGYNRLGLNAGIGTHYMFSPKTSVSLELLYSQKGSQTQLNPNNVVDFRKIALDYVDIPILFNFHDKNIAIFQGGLSIGRLIRAKEFLNGDDITDPEVLFNSIDVEVNVGATFLIKERFGLNGRFGYSIIKLGTFSGSTTKNDGYYNHLLSLRLLYFFK